MTRIAVADDSEVIRNLIDEIIRYEPELELVGSFEDGPQIVAWTREGGRADIYLIDMRLPGLSGTATIRALRRFLEDERIIAFSASAQEASIKSALEAGANQYVVKDASLADLLAALHVTGDGSDAAALDGAGPPPKQTPSAGDTASDIASQPETVGDRMTVMVVDDHEIVREATAALLDSRGLATVTFDTVEATLEWIDAGGRPEAALIDLRMGGERATGFLKQLREELPEAAIFVHSGVSNADGRQVAATAGVDGFIAKGELSAESMEATISRVVAQRRAGPQ